MNSAAELIFLCETFVRLRIPRSQGSSKKRAVDPVGNFKKQLKKYCRVVDLEEFRISKLHATCYGELANAYSQKFHKTYNSETKVKTDTIHRLFFYSTKSCHGMFIMNRGKNAAVNIHNILIQNLKGIPRSPTVYSSRCFITRGAPLENVKSFVDGRQPARWLVTAVKHGIIIMALLCEEYDGNIRIHLYKP